MIQAWLAKKGAQLWALLAAIAAAAAVVFGFYHNAKKAGVIDERERRQKDELERIDGEAVKRVEQAQAVATIITDKVGNANEALVDVAKLGDGDAANKLRDEWSRD